MSRISFVCLLVAGYMVAASAASAQGKLCAPCQQSGERCCGLQASVSACVQCSVGFKYEKTGAEKWCRKNQPVCSRR